MRVGVQCVHCGKDLAIEREEWFMVRTEGEKEPVLIVTVDVEKLTEAMGTNPHQCAQKVSP